MEAEYNGPIPLVILQVLDEFDRQDAKWGLQDHPLIGGHPAHTETVRQLYALNEKAWKHTYAQQTQSGNIGWDSILLEEAHEALAAKDVDEQCKELIQVAAVALRAVQAIHRRHGWPQTPWPSDLSTKKEGGSDGA